VCRDFRDIAWLPNVCLIRRSQRNEPHVSIVAGRIPPAKTTAARSGTEEERWRIAPSKDAKPSKHDLLDFRRIA
jgi:hypothetical protein